MQLTILGYSGPWRSLRFEEMVRECLGKIFIESLNVTEVLTETLQVFGRTSFELIIHNTVLTLRRCGSAGPCS